MSNLKILIFVILLQMAFVNNQTDFDKIIQNTYTTENKYFTFRALYHSSSAANIRVQRQGLLYTPSDTMFYCLNISDGQTSSTNNANIALANTELDDLFLNTFYCQNADYEVFVKFIILLPNSSSDYYIVNIPLFNADSSSGQLSIDYYDQSVVSYFNIETGNITILAFSSYQLIIKIYVGISTTQFQISIQDPLATTYSTPYTANYNVSTYVKFRVILDTGSVPKNSVYLSTLTITKEVSTLSPKSISSSSNCSTDPCLPGYMCNGSNTCVACHASCLTCSNVTSSGCTTCRRHTSQWETGPVSGKCDISYINLILFNSITIPYEPPRTNRVTIGFWIWVKDDMAGRIINIVLQEFIMVSFTYTSAPIPKLTGYVVLLEDDISNLSVINTEASLISYLSAKNQYTSTNITSASPSIEKKWMYIKSGMSKTDMYIYLESDSVTNQSTITTNGNIIARVGTTYRRNEFKFHRIYRDQEKATIQILNANLLTNTNFLFIRNINIYKEYISYDIKDHIFNLHVFSNFNSNPELIASIPLDYIDITNRNIKLYEYNSTSPASPIITLITLPTSVTVVYTDPINFVRLMTISIKNNKYSSLNMNNITSMSKNVNQSMVFDDFKAFVCSVGFFLNTSTFLCNPDCAASTSILAGVFKSSTANFGKCNDPCQPSYVCKNLNSDIRNIESTFTCQASYYKFFYSCQDDSNDYSSSMYYSSRYKGAALEINFPLPYLTSYIIEFWFLEDTLHAYNLFQSSTARNYIFYSNTVHIFQVFNTSNFNALAVNGGVSTSVVNYNRNMWNKFIIQVNYNLTTNNTQIDLYLNNTQTPLLLLAPTPISQDLINIIFCDTDIHCSQTINWSSGFYKKLKIWDITNTNYDAIVMYETLYPSSETSSLDKRAFSLVRYYPLTMKYLSSNILKDNDYPAYNIDFATPYTLLNIDNLQLLNYGQLKYDFLKSEFPAGNKFINNYTRATLTVTTSNCTSNCVSCWASNALRCYECDPNYILKYTKCTQAHETYFRSPADSDITFNSFPGISPKGTITFWVKPFGFKSDISDMISYSPTLKLQADSTLPLTNTYYGLNLISNSNVYLLTVNDFFSLYLGKWTLISLSYYHYSTIDTYFPPMMKFVINNKPYPLISTITSNDIKNLDISTFIIYQTYFGLITKIKAYNDFIISAYQLETNSSFPVVPTSTKYLIPGNVTLGSSCYNTANASPATASFKCIQDYDEIIADLPAPLKCNTKTNIFTPAVNISVTYTCSNSATNCNNGISNNAGNNSDCVCYPTEQSNSNNYNSYYLYKNNNDIQCSNASYVNLAKMNNITMSNAGTAKTSKTYTLQLWYYINGYSNTAFQSVSLSWNYHNKIVLKLTGGIYQAICHTSYDSSSTAYENAFSDQITFTSGTWSFLSCSVDFSIASPYKYYLNNEISSKTGTFTSLHSPNLLSQTTSTLLIKDESTTIGTWGVMYMKQIRLWNILFTNVGYLARVDIQTPSLFPNLLNLYDTDYIYTANNSDLIINDLTGISSPVVVTYTESTGLNVISQPQQLTLCSENTSYYDIPSSTCINIANIANLDNILSFNNIDVSYTNNATIEFWLFSESFASLTEGVNIIYTDHIGINLRQKTVTCYPQEYKVGLKGIYGVNIDTLSASTLNKSTYTLPIALDYGWVNIRCAASLQQKKYYINIATPSDINNDILFDSAKTLTPYKYFFLQGSKTTLIVENFSSQLVKVYLRSLYVFSNYLQQNFQFSNMNLSNLAYNEFPDLVFACDFNNYTAVPPSISYSVFDNVTSTKVVSSLTLTLNAGNPSKNVFPTSFTALTLCDVTLNTYYDTVSQACANATCNKVTLNALYCLNTTVAFICNNGYFFNSANNTCNTSCPATYTKTQGIWNSTTTKGYCNFQCDMSSVNQCPYTTISQLQNFNSNFTCNTGFINSNYSCIDQMKDNNNAIYYSRCFKSPNISTIITTPGLTNGYILDFWFKIDTFNNQTSINKKCLKDYPLINNEYYLLTNTHIIYFNSNTSTFHYDLLNTSGALMKQITSINNFNWNNIVIKTQIKVGSNQINLYINNVSEYTILNSSIPLGYDLKFLSMSFCSGSSGGVCKVNGNTLNNIQWGSAYYKNIKV